MSIVVTGVGSITPGGNTFEDLWVGSLEGISRIASIDRFPIEKYGCSVAGQAAFDPASRLRPRFIKRTDRFSHLAVACVQDALADADVTVGVTVEPERIGITVGNVLGGWEFAERELRHLWTGGPRSVSPYQATAWFPAAPQGNACMEFGLKGPSRTLVADRASGAYALTEAASALRLDKADMMVVGGVEAPLSPYGWLCLETSGLSARVRPGADPSAAYRAYGAGHGGSVFGEGATFLVLEREEFARARGARPLGRLAGWSTTTDGYMPYYTVNPDGLVLARAMGEALRRAGIGPADVQVVYPHGSAVPVEDVTDFYAIEKVFGEGGQGVPLTVPKTGFGHLLGAAAPTDVALALRTLAVGVVPPTPGYTTPAPGIDVQLRDDAVPVRDSGGCGAALVVSRGLGGVNVALVLTTE